MIILLKWHEIHDNGLYSVQILSSVIYWQSILLLFRTMQDHTHRSTFVWKEKSKTMDFNLILVFPSVWLFNSHFKSIQLSCSKKQEKEFRIYRPHPIPQVNDLRTTWSRLNLHFTSKKGNVHTWGGSGVNNNYLKPGFYHFCLQLPTVFESAWLLPADAQFLALWTGLWIEETFSKLRPKWK